MSMSRAMCLPIPRRPEFSAWALCLSLGSGLVGGCAFTPSTIVQQPLTARAQPAAQMAAGNGAIYQAATYRPLFEDHRARLVGDTITIAVNEKTSAGKAASSSASKTANTNFGAPTVVGLPLRLLQNDALATKTDNKYADAGATNSSNSFVATIAVTVIEVLPNGNMVVAGEKQIAFDKGAEFVRFSGVVNPDTITAGNIVSSTQVADAKLEYRTNSRIDTADVASWFTRFFLSVLPL